MSLLIDVKHISFGYLAQNVVENVSFSVNSGDFWAIIGPNGGGKSTLIKLILGLLKPRCGEIVFKNNMHLKHIGYVPQNTYFNTSFPINALDVIALGLLQPSVRGFRLKTHLLAVQEIMKELDITHLAQSPMNALSGGERQKVLIARALVCKPKILILDEPTANVDVKAQKAIYELLSHINKSVSIIVISHDIALTLGYAKKVLYMNKYAHIHDALRYDFHIKQDMCEMDILAFFADIAKQQSKDSADSKNTMAIIESTEDAHKILKYTQDKSIADSVNTRSTHLSHTRHNKKDIYTESSSSSIIANTHNAHDDTTHKGNINE